MDSNLGFNAKGRAYMLFMAMQVQPPSFDRPGIDDFSTYPTLGGSPQGIRDAVNWEISGHLRGGRWATYFYFTEENSGPAFTPDQMNADIVADIAGSGAPVIVAVDADYLPNWPDLAKPLHHASPKYINGAEIKTATAPTSRRPLGPLSHHAVAEAFARIRPRNS